MMVDIVLARNHRAHTVADSAVPPLLQAHGNSASEGSVQASSGHNVTVCTDISVKSASISSNSHAASGRSLASVIEVCSGDEASPSPTAALWQSARCELSVYSGPNAPT